LERLWKVTLANSFREENDQNQEEQCSQRVPDEVLLWAWEEIESKEG